MKITVNQAKVEVAWELSSRSSSMLARQLAIGGVPGSNTSKGENLLISDKKGYFFFKVMVSGGLYF